MKNLLVSSALLLSSLIGSVFAQALTPQQIRERDRQRAQTEAPSSLAQQLAKVTDINQLLAAARAFESKQEWRNLQDVYERIAALRPFAGNIRYELAATYALQDEKRKAYDALINLQVQGYAYDPSADERFKKVSGTPVYDYILKNLQANAVPFGEGKTAFSLDAGDHLFEAIAHDGKRQQFLIGSARDGSVSLVDGSGKRTPFITASADNGLWSVTDLAVDQNRQLLWVASSGLPHFKGIKESDLGAGGIFKFDLNSGKLLARFDLPSAQRPYIISAITISPKGDVFVADDAGRRIYRINDQGLNLFVQNPKLSSIRAMTMSGNGEILYFADVDLGIFGVRLSDMKPFSLFPSKNLTLLGIEGMSEWQGHLVIVQNAFPPARVMRLKLSDDGSRVEQSVPVDAARPELIAPTQGVVVGKDYYLIANSQKDKYDQYGIPRDAKQLEAVTIFKSNLDIQVDPRGGQVRPLGG